jgi:hypothetical protein
MIEFKGGFLGSGLHSPVRCRPWQDGQGPIWVTWFEKRSVLAAVQGEGLQW